MDVAVSEALNVLKLGGALLEGPVWIARDRALWFVDIKGGKIHRRDPTAPHNMLLSWQAPEQVGFVLPCEDGQFIAGLKSGLHWFLPTDGSFSPLVNPEPDLPGNRLNDGTVDPQGRLWFGSMDDDEVEPSGSFYRLRADGSCERQAPRFAITNGPAFSPDGKTIYYTDTLGGVIYTAQVSDLGRLSADTVFATIPNAEGYPDGLTVDAEGCVWTGLYKGWAVRRYSPKGELLETVPFPVSAITKIAFGGPDLKTVFCTTAAKHLTPEERAKEPGAGDLFSFKVSVPGLPGHEVRLSA
jgi:D-xylonolactonase